MNFAPLGEHATLIRGITFKPSDKCDPGTPGSVVCLRTSNIQEKLDESDLIAVPSTLVKSSEKHVRLGDVLVSSANSWNLVGKCCRVSSLRFASTAGGFISILRPTTDALDPSYLYRWFSWERTQDAVRSFGRQTTNISNLDHKRTLLMSVPLPPLDVQKRIAEILDAADVLKAKRQASITTLDSLVQSTFLEMFGDPIRNPKMWDVSPLGELGTLVNGRAFKASEWEETGVPIIRIQNLNNSEKPFNYTTHTWPHKFFARTGDVLLSWSGTPGTSFGCFRWRGPDGWVNQHIFRVEVSPSIDATYYIHAVNARLAQIIQKAHGGVGLKHITKSKLESVEVAVPPVSLQSRFASFCKSVETQKARLSAQYSELESLFSALQSLAFNGELLSAVRLGRPVTAKKREGEET